MARQSFDNHYEFDQSLKNKENKCNILGIDFETALFCVRGWGELEKLECLCQSVVKYLRQKDDVAVVYSL